MKKDTVELLQSGVFLDQENILIPWFTPIEDLHSFGVPEVYDEQTKPSGLVTYKTPYKTFVWRNKIWCGFNCSIDTVLYNRDAEKLKNISEDQRWRYSSELRYFYIHANLSKDVTNEYIQLKNIFVDQFGEPTKSKIEILYEREYPWNLWIIGKIQLTLVMQERFEDFNTIMVRVL